MDKLKKAIYYNKFVDKTVVMMNRFCLLDRIEAYALSVRKLKAKVSCDQG